MAGVTEVLGRAKRLDRLSDADLDALEAELVGTVRSIRAGEVPGVARDDLDTLSKLRDAVAQTREAVKQRRSAKTAEQEAAAAALEAEILGTEGEPTQKASAATKAAPAPAKAKPTAKPAGGAGVREWLPWGLAGFVVAGLITALVFIMTGDDGDGKKEQAATTKPAATTAPTTSTTAATTTTTTIPATTSPAVSSMASAWLTAIDIETVVGDATRLAIEQPNEFGGTYANYDVGIGGDSVGIQIGVGASADDYFQMVMEDSRGITGEEPAPVPEIGTEAYRVYTNDILVRVANDRVFYIYPSLSFFDTEANFGIATNLAQFVIDRIGG